MSRSGARNGATGHFLKRKWWDEVMSVCIYVAFSGRNANKIQRNLVSYLKVSNEFYTKYE